MTSTRSSMRIATKHSGDVVGAVTKQRADESMYGKGYKLFSQKKVPCKTKDRFAIKLTISGERLVLTRLGPRQKTKRKRKSKAKVKVKVVRNGAVSDCHQEKKSKVIGVKQPPSPPIKKTIRTTVKKSKTKGVTTVKKSKTKGVATVKKSKTKGATMIKKTKKVVAVKQTKGAVVLLKKTKGTPVSKKTKGGKRVVRDFYDSTLMTRFYIAKTRDPEHAERLKQLASRHSFVIKRAFGGEVNHLMVKRVVNRGRKSSTKLTPPMFMGQCAKASGSGLMVRSVRATTKCLNDKLRSVSIFLDEKKSCLILRWRRVALSDPNAKRKGHKDSATSIDIKTSTDGVQEVMTSGAVFTLSDENGESNSLMVPMRRKGHNETTEGGEAKRVNAYLIRDNGPDITTVCSAKSIKFKVGDDKPSAFSINLTQFRRKQGYPDLKPSGRRPRTKAEMVKLLFPST